MRSSSTHYAAVRARWPLATSAVTLALLGPALAHASNTGKPRVPPSFLGTTCIETIDRSIDPVWSFDVGIPFEDNTLTEDEPPDGRTFQFFALCRQPTPLEVLPLWVDATDATTAIEFDPTIEQPAPGEALNESEAWSDCVEVITPAQDRIPITCTDTINGASWDTTGISAGTYAIWGYTYEPAQNIWTPRDGVVRVIDSDDASAGPAVSFSWPLTEVTAGLDAGVRIAGCLAGMEGTTLSLAWATASALTGEGDTAWQTFTQLDDPGPTFDAALIPPTEAEYEAIFFRATAEDPQGRSFVAYTRERVVFLAGCDDPDGGARSLPDDCAVGSGSPSVPEGERGGGGCDPTESGSVDDTGSDPGGTMDSTSGSTDSSGDGPTAADDQDSGCGCQAAPTHRAWWSLLLLSIGIGLRRSITDKR